MTIIDLSKLIIDKINEINSETSYKSSRALSEVVAVLEGVIKETEGYGDANCLKAPVISPIFFFAKEMESFLYSEFKGYDLMRSDITTEDKIKKLMKNIKEPSYYSYSSDLIDTFKNIREKSLKLGLLAMVLYDTAFHSLTIKNSRNIYAVITGLRNKGLPLSTANTLFLRSAMEDAGYEETDIDRPMVDTEHYKTEYMKMISEMVNFNLEETIRKLEKTVEENQNEEENDN